MKKPRIKYSFIYQSLKDWLKVNHHRFPTTPYITRLKPNSFSLRFSKVKNIEVYFSENVFIEVFAWYGDKLKPEHIVYLAEFDLFEKKNELGNRRDDLDTPDYNPFVDRETLYELEVYEPLLAWTLKNITPENYLCIHESKNKGALWMNIIHSSELDKQKYSELIIYCKPVICKARLL